MVDSLFRNSLKYVFLTFIVMNYAYGMEPKHPYKTAEQHNLWVTTVNATAEVSVKTMISEMNEVYKQSQLLPYSKCADESSDKKKNILERLHTIRDECNDIKNTIFRLGTYAISKSEKTKKVGSIEKQLPITKNLLELFDYINTYLKHLLALNESRLNFERVNNTIEKFFCTVHLLFTSLTTPNAFEITLDTYPKLLLLDEKFYEPFLDFIGQFYYEKSYEKKMIERLTKCNKILQRKTGELLKKTKIAFQAFDEIANKPNLSELALTIINPGIKKPAVTFIESHPTVRRFLKATPAHGIINDIEQAQEQGMAPSYLMEQANKKIPKAVKPLLIWTLKNFGMYGINPGVWLFNKCIFPLRYAANSVEDLAGEMIEDAQNPVLEKQLLSYLRSIGKAYNTSAASLSIMSLLEERTKKREETLVIDKKLKELSFKQLLEQKELALKKYRELKAELRKHQMYLRSKEIQKRKLRLKRLINYKQEVINELLKEKPKHWNEIFKGRQQKINNLKQRFNKEYKNKKRELKLKIEKTNKLIDQYDQAFEQKAKEAVQEDPLTYANDILENGLLRSNGSYKLLKELIKKNRKNFTSLVRCHRRHLIKPIDSTRELFKIWLSNLVDEEYVPVAKAQQENEQFLKTIECAVKNEEEELKKQKEEFKAKIVQQKKFSNRLKQSSGVLPLLLDIYYYVKNKFNEQPIKKKQAGIASSKKLYESCKTSAENFEKQSKNIHLKMFTKHFNDGTDTTLFKKKLVAVVLKKNSSRNRSKKNAEVSNNFQITLENRNQNNTKNDYSINHETVTVQNGQYCGYHAAYNALNSFGLPMITLEPFLEKYKKRVALKRKDIAIEAMQDADIDKIYKGLNRHEKYADNLDENEVRYIIADMQSNLPITLIPDIYRYERGNYGLDLSVLNDVTEGQQAFERSTDYSRVYVLGTMSEESKTVSDHWIAVKQEIVQGKVNFTVMNSLPAYECQEAVTTLLDILTIKNKKYRLNHITENQAEKIKMLIKTIEFSEAFNKRKYALEVSTKRECNESGEVIIREMPHNLIMRIIDGCKELLDLTNGKRFYCCCGRIDPLARVENAVNALESCDQKDFTLKNYADEPGVTFPMSLEDIHKAALHDLKRRCENLKQLRSA
jgi:hypothetical protein